MRMMQRFLNRALQRIRNEGQNSTQVLPNRNQGNTQVIPEQGMQTTSSSFDVINDEEIDAAQREEKTRLSSSHSSFDVINDEEIDAAQREEKTRLSSSQPSFFNRRNAIAALRVVEEVTDPSTVLGAVALASITTAMM